MNADPSGRALSGFEAYVKDGAKTAVGGHFATEIVCAELSQSVVKSFKHM